MARLGIDFGTTNTVVVASDRGRYPVVLHGIDTRAGHIVEEVFPSTIWIDRNRGEWLFGLEAERRARKGLAQKGAAIVTSLKRELRRFTDGLTIDVGGGPPVEMEDLLVRFLGALRGSIVRSGEAREGEPLKCVISWPANSNGAQRYITRRAFRQAGFEVLGSVNEPTASAVEYADRAAKGNPAVARRLKGAVAVFDLGGGTFDASLVSIDGPEFRVVDAAGVERLGGDDFDHVLLEMFLEPLGMVPRDIDGYRKAALLRHARLEKESIARDPDRSWLEFSPADYAIDSGSRALRHVRVPVAAYYERLRPLVQGAVSEMEWILEGPRAQCARLGPDRIDAIYLVGGSSRLPLIPKIVHERFPTTKVVASERPFTSIAMGAAILSSEKARVSDIIGRHFGVIRLKDAGRREYFDPIFNSGTRLPQPGEPPLEIKVAYRPRHNIGNLRYLECRRVGKNELPEGESRTWSSILFPYDPSIPPERPLEASEVRETDRLAGTEVVERYWCDSDGVITVKLERRVDGRMRTFEISRD
jgi:molecular chaperone DnaK (HSP70)